MGRKAKYKKYNMVGKEHARGIHVHMFIRAPQPGNDLKESND